jgi:Surface adhesin CshA non-repetitive domain 2
MVAAAFLKSGLRLLACVVVAVVAMATASLAATCGPATSPGTAPATWQTYCWIDMTSYSNSTVMGAGQTFAITLSDGSVFNFKLNGTASPGTTGLTAIAPPSWTGSAVGNTAFLGIPNKPILYLTAGGTVTLTMSNISITPAPGGSSSGLFKVIIADAESTNNGESLSYTTNGGNWSVIDQVDPTSGSTYPGTSNSGTTFTETGVAGTVGAYIVGTQSPTTVTATIVGSGLQGIMFAVQYATLSVNKTISGGRSNSADQFTYTASSAAGTMATKTSSGTGNGPFTAAVSTISASVPITISETLAAGSASVMAQYTPSLTCTNGFTGSSTVLPTAVATTSYVIPSFEYGDAVSCMFTNTPKPATIAIKKITSGAIGGPFKFTQTNLASNPVDISTATIGVAAPASPTPINATTLNTAVTIIETAFPKFTLTAVSCSDANSAVTGNTGTFGTFSGNTVTIPALYIEAAAQITCTLTNTAAAPSISLQKALGGVGRVAAADQFSLQATGTGAPANVTTTGTGAAVTSAAMTFNATAGSSYVLNEAMAAGSTSSLLSYVKTPACTNGNAVGTNVSSITTLPINLVPALGDSISCVITNQPIIAKLTISKVAPTSGPVSLGTIVVYTYTVSNTGNVNINNVSITDMHGSPAVQLPLGAGGITNETLTVPGALGAAASPDSTANNGIWTTLAPGATIEFIYTHTVTQAEMDHG